MPYKELQALRNTHSSVHAGELAKLQSYHCGLLRLLFLASNDADAPACSVSMAVVNDAVKVAITPRRLVRPLGGARMHDSIGRLLDVIMEDYWNFKAPATAGESGDPEVWRCYCLRT